MMAVSRLPPCLQHLSNACVSTICGVAISLSPVNTRRDTILHYFTKGDTILQYNTVPQSVVYGPWTPFWGGPYST